MLTTMQIMSAAGVVAYFGRELSTSEYYTAEHGVWYEKGAERLGLPSDLTKEDFVALANNRIPQSGDRLTARTNDTRTHIVWELDEETQSRVPKEKEVNYRRVCVDFTFSVPKSVSMYLAKTKDEEVEKLIHQALRETMDDIEAEIQTRVRIGGADYDRVTGNAIWAKCIHRTTRPVSGRVDPHWHCHALLFNATYDETEKRWKAAQLGNVIANKGIYQAAFHSRIAEKLIAAGHRLRRTERDFEMDVFTHEEIRVFCKRTKQIERLERELRTQVETRTGAIVRAAAKRGDFVDYEEQYAAEKAKLGAEYREAKNRARLQGEAWSGLGKPTGSGSLGCRDARSLHGRSIDRLSRARDCKGEGYQSCFREAFSIERISDDCRSAKMGNRQGTSAARRGVRSGKFGVPP